MKVALSKHKSLSYPLIALAPIIFFLIENFPSDFIPSKLRDARIIKKARIVEIRIGDSADRLRNSLSFRADPNSKQTGRKQYLSNFLWNGYQLIGICDDKIIRSVCYLRVAKQAPVDLNDILCNSLPAEKKAAKVDLLELSSNIERPSVHYTFANEAWAEASYSYSGAEKLLEKVTVSME